MRSLLISFFDIVYFLIIVFIFTCWILLQIILNFSWKPTSYYYDSFYFLNTKLVPYNNTFLEFIWTVIPIIIFILVFIPLLKLLRVLGFEDTFIINKKDNQFFFPRIGDSNQILIIENMYSIWKNFFKYEDNTIIIKIIGNQWYWMYESCVDFANKQVDIDSYFDDEILFSYLEMENSSMNNSESNDIVEFKMSKYIRLLSTDFYLTLKSNCYISFFITAYDVLHCWALPSAGIKVDACPGRISSSKVLFKDYGFFYGQCSELCGFLHGFMPISVRIV